MQSIQSFCGYVYNRASKIFGAGALVAAIAALKSNDSRSSVAFASIAAMSGTLAISSKADLPTRTIAVVGAGTSVCAVGILAAVTKTAAETAKVAVAAGKVIGQATRDVEGNNRSNNPLGIPIGIAARILGRIL